MQVMIKMDNYSLYMIILGMMLVSIGIAYKILFENRKQFRVLVYTGIIVIISGGITSEFIEVVGVFGIVLCVFIFVVASIIFAFQSRKDRKKGINR